MTNKCIRDKNNGFSKYTNKPFISALCISICVLISRFTGLIRDIFFAKYLGTGLVSEAFYVAFRLPNTFRRIFAEGALSNAFIPFFSSKNKENSYVAKHFSFKVFYVLTIALIVLTIVMEIFMPTVIKIINPGFVDDENKFILTVQLSRIAFPYVVLISLTSFFGAILNSVGSFWQFSFVSVLLNIFFVIGMLLTKQVHSNIGAYLCWVLIIAGIAQLFFVLFFCIKKSLLPICDSKNLSIQDKEANKHDFYSFFKKLLPAIISSGILQINIFVDGIFASFFAGAVSYLYYTDRIIQFPLSIIGYSLSVALLPSLSIAFKEKNIKEIAVLQVKSLNVALFFSIPAMFLIGTLSKQITQLLFERGEFSHNNTIVVAYMLIIFSLSIPCNVLLKCFFSCFYSQKNTIIPLKISIFALIFNIFSNIFLVKIIGMYCVAVSTTLSSILSCCYAIYFLKKSGSFFIQQQDLTFALKIFTISIISCVVVPIVLFKINIFIILLLAGCLHFYLCFRCKILTKTFLKELLNKKSCN